MEPKETVSLFIKTLTLFTASSNFSIVMPLVAWCTGSYHPGRWLLPHIRSIVHTQCVSQMFSEKVPHVCSNTAATFLSYTHAQYFSAPSNPTQTHTATYVPFTSCNDTKEPCWQEVMCWKLLSEKKFSFDRAHNVINVKGG